MGGFFTDVQEVEPQGGAKVHAWLYQGNEARGPRIPGAVVTKLGKGEIAAITMNIGARYNSARTTVARDFLQSLIRRLMPEPMVEVTGSHKLAVTLMKKDESLLLNLVNTGGDHHGGCYTFDEIPPVGPVVLTLRLEESPNSVKLQPGNRSLEWTCEQGLLSLEVPRVDVHEIVQLCRSCGD